MLALPAQIELELRKYIRPEVFEVWMVTPNEHLSHQSPAYLLSRSQFQPLWNLVWRLERQTRLVQT